MALDGTGRTRAGSLLQEEREEELMGLTEERIERIAAVVHAEFLRAAKELGWPPHPEVDVPYEQLSETAKGLDRAFARWHLAALAETEREREEIRTLGASGLQDALDEMFALRTRVRELEEENARLRVVLTIAEQQREHMSFRGPPGRRGEIGDE